MKYHKTHYKLSESVQLLGGGSVNIGGNTVTGSGGVVGIGGGGGGGRERLKLEVQSLPRTTGSVTGLPWRKILTSPPVR